MSDDRDSDELEALREDCPGLGEAEYEALGVLLRRPMDCYTLSDMVDAYRIGLRRGLRIRPA